MGTDIDELAKYLVAKLDSVAPPERFVIGIAGIPASGKSTFAQLLTTRVNEILADRRDQGTEEETTAEGTLEHDEAILISLDGWHLTREQLNDFPNSQEAHDRRGIHWTFDSAGYVAFLRRLRNLKNTSTLTAPTFDHALKDPTPDAISIGLYHRIVIIEGLYVFLNIEPWQSGGRLLDERWFLEIDEQEARERIVKRHVLTGVAKDSFEAGWRADENDMPNGKFILENMLDPTRVIKSKNMPIVP
ncbi:P-loop containing nucleoside triphosphate hydrolase protein [Agrocybe pediades]|nr:P-loop containing nucleoside triphosphate hydrolase protein [Agrocybe pediades]